MGEKIPNYFACGHKDVIILTMQDFRKKKIMRFKIGSYIKFANNLQRIT